MEQFSQSVPGGLPEWGQPEGASSENLAVSVKPAIVMGLLAGVIVLLVVVPIARSNAKAASGQSAGADTRDVRDAAKRGSTLPSAVEVGRIAPDFAIETPDGISVKLSDLRGRPVWINFWATWCPPCRAEMPEMKQKYARLKDQGLAILGVDVGESAEQVRQFINRDAFDWTFALDETGSVSQQYRASGLPTHIFVGPDEVIRVIQVGAMPSLMMDRYLSEIVSNQ